MPRIRGLALSAFPRHVSVSNAAFAQESPDDRESVPVSPQRRTTVNKPGRVASINQPGHTHHATPRPRTGARPVPWAAGACALSVTTLMSPPTATSLLYPRQGGNLGVAHRLVRHPLVIFRVGPGRQFTASSTRTTPWRSASRLASMEAVRAFSTRRARTSAQMASRPRAQAAPDRIRPSRWSSTASTGSPLGRASWTRSAASTRLDHVGPSAPRSWESRSSTRAVWRHNSLRRQVRSGSDLEGEEFLAGLRAPHLHLTGNRLSWLKHIPCHSSPKKPSRNSR
jgi:hypothetical protein